MNHIGMPAKKLTASCIWNSFLNSGKRHIILTGRKGCGKTTLLGKLFPRIQPGITTWACPKQAVYLKDNLSNNTVQVGVFDSTLPGPGNQMAVLHDGFSSLGITALTRCMESDNMWCTIDEIGYLEAQCDAYQDVLRTLMEKKNVAAVVRKQEIPFLKELCCRNDVFVVDLDDPFGDIGCVIMASGLSKRFGSNKLMADFHGRPLISYVIDVTENIFSQRVVVTRCDDVARFCQNHGVSVVLHSLPYRSDTVKLGLEALHGIERCMFIPSDQPLLRHETVSALALASKNIPEFIWRTIYSDIPGTPVIFPKWTFQELSSLREGQGGGVVIKKHPEFLRTVNTSDINELKDIDTPDDLAELLKV